MKFTNLTPWVVTVYSGYAHWDKVVYEEAFHTMYEAKDCAKTIEKYHPEYRIEIIKED